MRRNRSGVAVCSVHEDAPASRQSIAWGTGHSVVRREASSMLFMCATSVLLARLGLASGSLCERLSSWCRKPTGPAVQLAAEQRMARAQTARHPIASPTSEPEATELMAWEVPVRERTSTRHCGCPSVGRVGGVMAWLASTRSIPVRVGMAPSLALEMRSPSFARHGLAQLRRLSCSEV
jgi:hypothetical protein